MFKKILSAVAALLIVASAGDFVSSAPYSAETMTASAEDYTEGTYESLTYQKYDNYITISGCDNSATEVNIPAKIEGMPVTQIDDFSFSQCYNLTSVTIPDSVTLIGWQAFYKCTSLESIVIPDSVVSLRQSAFSSCTSLKDVTLSSSLKSPGGYTFVGCTSLESIVIPDGYESLGYCTFSGCKNLKSITIPESVKYVDGYTFDFCDNLTDIFYSGTKESWDTISINPEFNSSFLNATVHYGGTSSTETGPCGEYLTWKFDYTTDTLTISGKGEMLPNTPAQFGYVSPWNNFNDKIKSVIIEEGVTTIMDFAFSDCSALESVIIPNSVTVIGRSAFSECVSLTSVYLPNNVEKICSSAFYNCESLTDITIENPKCEILLRLTWEIDGDTTICNRYSDKAYFDGTIHGYLNSTAQEHAECFGHKFEAIDETKMGDIDGDGIIDSSDATLVLIEYSLLQTGGEPSFTSEQFNAADTNKDGIIDSTDASKILTYYADISTGKNPSWD